MKLRVFIARLSRGHWERSEVGTWLKDCYLDMGMARLPHVERVFDALVDGEPASCARNSAVDWARQIGAGVLVMADNDMGPHPDFLKRATRFLYQHPGPVVIGSPYCGARPARDVQVFRKNDFARVGRAEAAVRRGVELVGAIGTGLLACNLAAFDKIEPPYFDYEYDGPERRRLTSTEDFVFGRNLSEAGGRVYCDWDCWSTHFKVEGIGKPESEPGPEQIEAN